MLSRPSVCLSVPHPPATVFLISRCLRLPRGVGSGWGEEGEVGSHGVVLLLRGPSSFSRPLLQTRKAGAHPSSPACPVAELFPISARLCCPPSPTKTATMGPLPSCASRGPSCMPASLHGLLGEESYVASDCPPPINVTTATKTLLPSPHLLRRQTNLRFFYKQSAFS